MQWRHKDFFRREARATYMLSRLPAEEGGALQMVTKVIILKRFKLLENESF